MLNSHIDEDLEFGGGIVLIVLAILFLHKGHPWEGLITAAGAVLALWHNFKRRTNV